MNRMRYMNMSNRYRSLSTTSIFASSIISRSLSTSTKEAIKASIPPTFPVVLAHGLLGIFIHLHV